MKSAILAASLLISSAAAGPAFAQSLDQSGVLCQVIGPYRPGVNTTGSDAAYRPNVDVHGRPVAPADTNLPLRFHTDVVRIPLTVDLAQRLNVGLPQGTELETVMAMLELRQDGSVTFNGQDITNQARTVCGIPPITRTPAPADVAPQPQVVQPQVIQPQVAPANIAPAPVSQKLTAPGRAMTAKAQPVAARPAVTQQAAQGQAQQVQNQQVQTQTAQTRQSRIQPTDIQWNSAPVQAMAAQPAKVPQSAPTATASPTAGAAQKPFRDVAGKPVEVKMSSQTYINGQPVIARVARQQNSARTQAERTYTAVQETGRARTQTAAAGGVPAMPSMPAPKVVGQPIGDAVPSFAVVERKTKPAPPAVSMESVDNPTAIAPAAGLVPRLPNNLPPPPGALQTESTTVISQTAPVREEITWK